MSHQAPPADASKVRAPRTAVPVTPQTRASSLTDLLGAVVRLLPLQMKDELELAKRHVAAKGKKAGIGAGARVGLPRFKKKGRSRDSFTIPAPEVIGAAGTPYKRGEPRRGVITDHRHLRLASLGTIRTYDKTSRLVRACRRGAQIRAGSVVELGGQQIEVVTGEAEIDVPW